MKQIFTVRKIITFPFLYKSMIKCLWDLRKHPQAAEAETELGFFHPPELPPFPRPPRHIHILSITYQPGQLKEILSNPLELMKKKPKPKDARYTMSRHSLIGSIFLS